MAIKKSDADKQPFVLKIDNKGNVVTTRFSGDAGGEIKGSIQQTNSGLSYLVAVGGITITSQSNGQILISASAGEGGVSSSRSISTTVPITGGGDLSADRTLALQMSPTSSFAVGHERSISTTAPIAGGGNLGADRTLTLQMSPTSSFAVGHTRTINTTAPLQGGGTLAGDLTLSLVSASASTAGGMSAADYTKLSAIPSNVDSTFNALGAATASFSVNSQIINNVGSPTAGVHAASRGWVESITGSIAGSSPAYTVFDTDFTALSNQTIVTGSNTISGRTWIGENIANASPVPGITASVGLVVVPSATPTDFNGSTRTTPILRVNLNDTITNFDPRARLAIWCHFTGTAYTTNYQFSAIFAECDTRNSWLWRASRVFSTSDIFQIGNTLGTSANNTDITGSLHFNVLRLELPNGVASTYARLQMGTYSSGFPALSAMQERYVKLTTLATTPASYSPEAGANLAYNATTFSVGMAAGIVSSGVSHTTTFKRFRLDYMP